MDSTCLVTGCERQRRANSYCAMHNSRQRRTGSPGPARALYVAGRLCSIEGCGGLHQAHGWCNVHYKRWRKYGDPLTPPGEWRGGRIPRPSTERPTWKAMHHRLHARRGRASEHTCAYCTASAKDWAYDNSDPNEVVDVTMGMAFSLDLDRYVPMCRSCHKRFDLLHKARDVISESAILRHQRDIIELLSRRVRELEALARKDAG